MFELHVSWWELIVRGALVYLALFAMVRLSGKRTVGQFTPFDLLVVMLLSEAVGNSLIGGDDSVHGGLIVAATLMTLNGLVGFISSRNKKLEHLLEGSPVCIGRDGQWFPQVYQRHRLGDADVERALREADCELKDMKVAFLETDGSICIMQR